MFIMDEGLLDDGGTSPNPSQGGEFSSMNEGKGVMGDGWWVMWDG
jgi:hypothetical protein